jgi:hypothetical protein
MKEVKGVKIQIRITPTEKNLLDKLMDINKSLTISKMFRSCLHKTCEKHGVKIDVENSAQ